MDGLDERVRLSRAAQRRAVVLNQLLAGELSNGQAAELLGLSMRQVQRLRAAYRAAGPVALVHGNAGRVPWHALPAEIRARVEELATTRHVGLNYRHLLEKLAEEGIDLHRTTVVPQHSDWSKSDLLRNLAERTSAPRLLRTHEGSVLSGANVHTQHLGGRSHLWNARETAHLATSPRRWDRSERLRNALERLWNAFGTHTCSTLTTQRLQYWQQNAFGTALERPEGRLKTSPREVFSQCSPSLASSAFPVPIVHLSFR
jgi:Winged helix-turn helix